MPYAVRGLRRSPGFLAVAVLSLALGIGANATVFSFLHGMYFRMLPAPHPDRVMAIDRNGAPPCAWRDYLEFSDGLRSFSGITASQARDTFMDVECANFVIVAEAVSTNYADVLQVRPRLVGGLRRWMMPYPESALAQFLVRSRGSDSRVLRVKWLPSIAINLADVQDLPATIHKVGH
jgi:hypothetical protein